MNHNHCHHDDHCLHLDVKYCPHCDVVYCRDCGREWGSRGWYYPYTYPWTYYGNITYTDNNNNTPTVSNVEVTCQHH